MIIEACVGNLKDALSAQSKGAHQIELCDRLDLDGISPPVELVHEVTSELKIPVKIIVNPKSEDYHYSDSEMEEISNYIQSISKYNLAGFVFGPVDKNGMPDLQALKIFQSFTSLPITFHKAIDASPDIMTSMEMLVDQGVVSSILTSGGYSTAWEGRDVLLNMNKIIEEKKSSIEIIAAGKIKDTNLNELHDYINVNYYHGKLIVGDL